MVRDNEMDVDTNRDGWRRRVKGQQDVVFGHGSILMHPRLGVLVVPQEKIGFDVCPGALIPLVGGESQDINPVSLSCG
jgi:hypothetical protein